MKANGLLQPITVRTTKSPAGFELVAGERRLRAATQLGWTDIPAIVREFDDREMLTLALVENLQRADLNALEEAEGYQRLVDDFGLTQQQVADAVGKDRTTVTGLLRLLSLPVAVRKMVEQGQITAGHARALLAVKNEKHLVTLANETVARQLSVRDVESRARAMGGQSPAAKTPSGKSPGKSDSASSPDPQLRMIEDRLRARLQTDVSIRDAGGNRGTIQVAFYNPDDLERILDIVLGTNRTDFD